MTLKTSQRPQPKIDSLLPCYFHGLKKNLSKAKQVFLSQALLGIATPIYLEGGGCKFLRGVIIPGQAEQAQLWPLLQKHLQPLFPPPVPNPGFSGPSYPDRCTSLSKLLLYLQILTTGFQAGCLTSALRPCAVSLHFLLLSVARIWIFIGLQTP